MVNRKTLIIGRTSSHHKGIKENGPKKGKLKFHFVYVIGLHAVQFGNNLMKKIPRAAKIGRGRRPSSIWLSEEFFESNYFQNWTSM